MSEEFSLKDKVFRSFLQDPTLGPEEMTAKLGAKYNSVKDAFAKLAKDGLLQRSGRGNYEPNYAGILIHLMDRVEELEKKGK
jgi:predicted transcriptional regulator